MLQSNFKEIISRISPPKQTIFFVFFLCLVLLLVHSAPVFAQNRFVLEIPCEGGKTDQCDLLDFVELTRRVINFLIALAIPIFAIGAAYAGWLLLTSGGNPSERDHAKDVLYKMVMGFVLMLSAWLIVYAITKPLLKDQGYSLLEETK